MAIKISLLKFIQSAKTIQLLTKGGKYNKHTALKKYFGSIKSKDIPNDLLYLTIEHAYNANKLARTSFRGLKFDDNSTLDTTVINEFWNKYVPLAYSKVGFTSSELAKVRALIESMPVAVGRLMQGVLSQNLKLPFKANDFENFKDADGNKIFNFPTLPIPKPKGWTASRSSVINFPVFTQQAVKGATIVILSNEDASYEVYREDGKPLHHIAQLIKPMTLPHDSVFIARIGVLPECTSEELNNKKVFKKLLSNRVDWVNTSYIHIYSMIPSIAEYYGYSNESPTKVSREVEMLDNLATCLNTKVWGAEYIPLRVEASTMATNAEHLAKYIMNNKNSGDINTLIKYPDADYQNGLHPLNCIVTFKVVCALVINTKTGIIRDSNIRVKSCLSVSSHIKMKRLAKVDTDIVVIVGFKNISIHKETDKVISTSGVILGVFEDNKDIKVSSIEELKEVVNARTADVV